MHATNVGSTSEGKVSKTARLDRLRLYHLFNTACSLSHVGSIPFTASCKLGAFIIIIVVLQHCQLCVCVR